MAYNDDVTQLYQQQLGRAPDAAGMDFYIKQLQSGMTPQQIAAEMQKSGEGRDKSANLFGITPTANLGNGVPDFQTIANKQDQYNRQNVEQQLQMNNPNIYGPNGSQVRTKNPDGTYSVTQSLSPALQQQLDAQNKLNLQLSTNASNIAGGQPLNYGGVQEAPQGDAANANQVREAMYGQQTQYLDPQYKQAQGDMDATLANQGIMPGSEAYNRAHTNFDLQKQKAYGDARNSAIQAGGNEQTRLFNIGMQGRQQGVSEANALHNAPINDLNALRSTPQVQLPQYGAQTGTTIPGVDYGTAAQNQYTANTGIQNANAAQSAQTKNGLFGLANTALQTPGVTDKLWDYGSKLFS